MAKLTQEINFLATERSRGLFHHGLYCMVGRERSTVHWWLTRTGLWFAQVNKNRNNAKLDRQGWLWSTIFRYIKCRFFNFQTSFWCLQNLKSEPTCIRNKKYEWGKNYQNKQAKHKHKKGKIKEHVHHNQLGTYSGQNGCPIKNNFI